MTILDFKLCKIPGRVVLGEGSFGKVYLAQHKDTEKFYAIKEIRKAMLVEYDIIEMIQLESWIMLTNDHNNLINMEYAFQSENTINFVMDLVQGGELSDFKDLHERFSEEVTKFYAV